MRKIGTLLATACLLAIANATLATDDSRELVQLPEKMQQHMLANMRDHLAAINEILLNMAGDDPDQAADIAEQRLGMSSLKAHGAEMMAQFMPEGMREAGNEMHRMASRFALKAQEGETMAAYATLAQVTSACVACHSAYRIR